MNMSYLGPVEIMVTGGRMQRYQARLSRQGNHKSRRLSGLQISGSKV